MLRAQERDPQIHIHVEQLGFRELQQVESKARVQHTKQIAKTVIRRYNDKLQQAIELGAAAIAITSKKKLKGLAPLIAMR